MPSVTITVELTPEALALSEKLRRMPEEFSQAIKRGMKRGLQYVEGQIIANRLTGKGPFPVSEHRLGVVTSRLRQSVRVTDPVVITDAGKSEIEGAIGSNVEYAAAHEFGFSGEVSVKGFTRKNPRGNILATFSGSTARPTKTRKKIASGISRVKAHTRHMNIPERAPFRTGIAENLDYIANEISNEIAAIIESK